MSAMEEIERSCMCYGGKLAVVYVCYGSERSCMCAMGLSGRVCAMGLSGRVCVLWV